jgi:mRNA interferase MazF
MRPVHLATLDKVRPVVVLTRESVRSYLTWVTVAPIRGTARGLTTEVPVGRANGLDHDSVITCDAIATIAVDELGEQIGFLLVSQESQLADAIAVLSTWDANDTIRPGKPLPSIAESGCPVGAACR